MTTNRLTAASAATVLTAAALAFPASATAASNSAVTSIPSPQGDIEMHVTANCAGTVCTFSTQANLLTPDGPIGFPGDAWARQTITLRSMDRNVWQEVSYSAPSGTPREIKGANHDNVLSKQLKSINNSEISVTTFGGGPIERFQVDGESTPTDWATGQPNTKADFIACSDIQVVFGGVNLSTPTACAQTRF
ncbi:hypothetical protein [Mycolicibacterium brisbanense]|uniref:Secreted protein n=1 Tax=Mycolicibacterium brisbanense TaxID=146020 RepID=A0A100VXI4_9MYCO|nr:hypothetical protein [Mycolicibacterium brisbanense]MCV7159213.1 hypothetical protein [Mycolicibacterium brisbanense]GAS87701.1 uncharacterized protein RMCB_1797 [Mycolicibacterium brisbanense]